MITDEQVRRIALFFLFSLMDEKVALQAAHKTVAALKASFAKRGGDIEIGDADLIRLLRKIHTQYRKLVPRNRPIPVPEAALNLNDSVEVASWFKFQRDTADNEVMAVTLSKIFGFSDEVIADGLNVSLGTARYRVGKGIRQLGTFVKAKV